jgi:hypothetical protein
VPLGFIPLRSRLPVPEGDALLPLLDSAGVKMSWLEDVSGNPLEAEGHILTEAVVEHVLMCFRNHDPRYP